MELHQKYRNIHVIVTKNNNDHYVLFVLNKNQDRIVWETAPVAFLSFGSPCYLVGDGSLGKFWLCLNNPTNMVFDWRSGTLQGKKVVTEFDCNGWLGRQC